MTSESDQEYRLKLYSETRLDLLKRQLSNSENVDRAVLTVSTASLGFSLAFLKDVVPIHTATYAWTMYSAWLLFVLAIIATLVSFFTSQKAIEVQLTNAERYYLEYVDDALKIESKYVVATDILNYTGATFFVGGLILACIFVGINLEKEDRMSTPKITFDGASIPKFQQVQKGASIPMMQAVPTKPQGGAPVPSFQKVPEPPSQPPSSATSGKK